MNNNLNNIFWQEHIITRVKREKRNGHKSLALWFTGLSGSGKSSIANALEQMLFKNNINTYVLDGDNIRSGLCADLSFSVIDRNENIRRISEVAKLMLDAGILVLISVISPYRHQRAMVAEILGKQNILEIFINTPISICEARDPKKLYEKSRLGKISDFTGIQTIYEEPKDPDVLLDGTDSLENNSRKLFELLCHQNILNVNELNMFNNKKK